MHRLAVRLGIDRDRRNAEPPRGSNNSAGNLTAIGDQDFGKHHRLWRYMRKTPNRVGSIGALSAAERESPKTMRVSDGSMIPSSQSRALA